MKPRAFDIDTAMRRIERAVEPYPKAALFELFDRGFTDPFEQLVACIISIRTLDETTVPATLRLFARARTPAALGRLSVDEIARLVEPATFARAKAANFARIAQLVGALGGEDLLGSFEGLVSLPGVGPKCAALVLGITGKEPRIGVDVHVHRIVNRWGYVAAPTPEKTMAALERKLPKRYWVGINRLLVPFGKHVCTGRFPHCSTCPVADMCAQVGVRGHR